MSKSRSGKTPNNSQNAPPATTQNAIIPGKFFESDWNELLEIEDDENFISDIIDEITDAACNQVYDNIIRSRVQPHTVLAARELLLDIIDWNFLQNDPGEVDTNGKLSWIEDDEPVECIIDNWAQGAVPKKDVEELDTIMEDKDRAIEVSPLPTDMTDSNSKEENDVNFLEYMLDDMNLEDSITDGDLVEKVENMALEDPNSLQSCEDTKELSVVVDVKNDTIESSTEKLPKSKKKKKYRPHVGSLPNFEKIPLDSVTDLRPKPGTKMAYDIENGGEYSIRNQYGRASGPKEVVYDERGQVVKVQKLNVANFPRYRVPVRYSIVDPEKEVTQPHKKSNKKINQTAEKSIQNRNKISAKTLLQRMHPSTSWDSAAAITDYGRNGNGHMEYKLQSRSPLPPLMVDSINVTDGVTIREGGLSKQVMKKSTQETSVGKRAIYPIANSMNNRILEVKDIVSETSPTFRYVGVSETLAGM